MYIRWITAVNQLSIVFVDKMVYKLTKEMKERKRVSIFMLDDVDDLNFHSLTVLLEWPTHDIQKYSMNYLAIIRGKKPKDRPHFISHLLPGFQYCHE